MALLGAGDDGDDLEAQMAKAHHGQSMPESWKGLQAADKLKRGTGWGNVPRPLARRCLAEVDPRIADVQRTGLNCCYSPFSIRDIIICDISNVKHFLSQLARKTHEQENTMYCGNFPGFAMVCWACVVFLGLVAV